MTKLKYDLVMKTREFREKTLCSVYYKPNKHKEKQFMPVDIDGYRYRLNKSTGEIENYTRQQTKDSIGASVRRSRIILNMILDMNDFDWFVTLTFDKSMVDRQNADAVYNCYSKYIDNLKHKYINLRYVFIPENHEDGCYHFHGLIGGCSMKQLGMVNSGKVCCHWADKKYNGICSKEYFEKTKHNHTLTETDGEPIYNLMTFQYGFTTASRICSRQRCNTYVKKYIDKNFGSTDIFKKRFFYSSNLKVPKIAEVLIGSDFNVPKDICNVPAVIDSLLYTYSEQQRYNENFNVMQFWVENNLKHNLEKDLIPLDIAKNTEVQIREF